MSRQTYPAGYAYEVLGVEKNADQDTIKRAYRKLAMKFHPDRNPGNADAEAQFKLIGKAWNVLENEEKRTMYDQGTLDFEGARLTVATSKPMRNMKDVMSEFFRSDDGDDEGEKEQKRERPARASYRERMKARQTAAPAREADSKPRHADIHCKLTVEFNEAALGATKRIELDHGNRAVTIKLPEGVRHLQKLRVSGKGNTAGGHTGDLYVEVHVNDHPVFTRDGDDIYMEVEIELEDAILGTRLEVETLRGTKEIDLPRGANTNEDICLEGEGIKGGDQYVTLRVVLPDEIDSELEAALTKWAEKKRAAQGVTPKL